MPTSFGSKNKYSDFRKKKQKEKKEKNKCWPHEIPKKNPSNRTILAERKCPNRTTLELQKQAQKQDYTKGSMARNAMSS